MQLKKFFLIIGFLVLLIGLVAGVVLISRKTINLKPKASLNAPENVSVWQISADGATISWITTGPVQGEVNYGLKPDALQFFKQEDKSTLNHVVKLEGLLPATKYFFVIKVGEQTFDENGQPYSFTTRPKQPTSAASPTPAPLSEEGLIKAIGTNDLQYDLNQDGVVNTLDLELLRQKTK